MASLTDYLQDLVQNSWTEVASAVAGLATATRAAEGAASGAAARHHIVCKCDASYSSSTQSGLLEIKFGTTVVAAKYCHGQTAIDFGIFGLENRDANEAVSAELAAGAGGITGKITLTGYSSGNRPGD